MEKYNPQEIEKKWQKIWEKNKASKIDKDNLKKKFYVLDMFPYPSGTGLHMGHTESYTASDVFYRFKKMQGFNVLHPQGFDSFGLPAENFAIKTGIHPSETTKKNMENYIRQMKSLGFAYDFDEQAVTSDPGYYKWTQWIFGKFFENGLVYKKTAKTNWCRSCQTVIANEQVVEGKCERCGTDIELKEVPSWFFKITDFAEELIDDLDKVDWPEHTKKNQRNWIGRSEGAVVKFKITVFNDKPSPLTPLPKGEEDNYVEVFTTRVDTIFGCTYLVVAPEHPIVKSQELGIKNQEEVAEYVKKAKNKTEMDRMEAKDKTGVEIKGIKAVNPFNGEQVPVFVADYVLGGYGTGAVMAVPAHDERDWEFAKKYKLPIKQSIAQVFFGEGENKVREDKPKTERDIADVIIKHWEKEEYFCLDWNNNNWKTFVVGGIEKGETLEEAAVREVTEESGYKNMKVVRQIGGEDHSYFFAAHKDVNRCPVRRKCILVELVDGTHEEPKKEHTKNHEGVWIKKEDVAIFLNLKELKICWDAYLNGEHAFIEDGELVDSGEFTGLKSDEARERMTAWLEENKLGKRKINYRLRDWSISRQRYWGCPIPIVYSPEGEARFVGEENLPWMLPADVDFVPTGVAPLAKSEELKKRVENIFGKGWTAEYDTMDTFVDSSWYFLRYPDAHNDKDFCSKERLEWLPVDLYIGGAEHTYMHLLFARFFVKAMKKIGLLDFDEPFLKLRHQGMVLDAQGKKMSKSKGNVVNPDEMIEKFGADSVRTYMLFAAPLEDEVMWNEQNIVGVHRFLDKAWRMQERIKNHPEKLRLGVRESGVKNDKLDSLMHKTIKKVTGDIENLRYNTTISALMILANEFEKQDEILSIHYSNFLILLSPFAPHVAEELWSSFAKATADEGKYDKYKESIFLQSWPEYDEKLIADEEVEMVVQVNGKVRDRMSVSADISEEDAKQKALSSEKVKAYLSGEVKKIIFVKGKLVNIVV
ncbi:MAG: leucyl-tRNA synthetase [Parcubacteria group bacterium Athens0714_25]|nr:MAG: leucyl-tRNA synthetase [Parcubacteria group bacterium Athens0714_25]